MNVVVMTADRVGPSGHHMFLFTACASEAAGKHTSAVWQLRWIEKEKSAADEHTEVLVSVSTDGRVTQWAIRKGFECTGTVVFPVTIFAVAS